MKTICKDISAFLEEIAPLPLAEEWDNVGLILGKKDQEINRAMVCMDITPAVADEALEKKVDLIISHHPLIFRGIDSIRGDDARGGIIYKLIGGNICVYCAHTNLDAAEGGVNYTLARILELKSIENLNTHRSQKLFKVVVFTPEESIEGVRNAMCGAGAGWIGKYSNCTFMTPGTGTFVPLEGTNPYTGKQGRLEKVSEYRLETIVPFESLKEVISSMLAAHPYEEVAYDVYPLELSGKEYGMGKIGVLGQPMDFASFAVYVRNKLDLKGLRAIGKDDKCIRKVACFCGSYDEKAAGSLKDADALVTGDIKYHTALDFEQSGMCVVDAGHFGTEKVIVPAILKLLSDKFPSVGFFGSAMERDPFKFY